ncbi:MAG: DUF4870 domain-containing protein [Gemmataceae bacterium]
MTEFSESFRKEPPSYRPPALEDSAAFRDKPPEGAVASDPAPSAGLTQDEKTWGMLCHLSALATLVVPGGSIGGPLVSWLIKKDQSAFIDRHGKESLNFQLNILIYFVITFALGFATFGVGWLLTAAVGVYGIVMPILAGLKANEGREYQYPYTFRLIN